MLIKFYPAIFLLCSLVFSTLGCVSIHSTPSDQNTQVQANLTNTYDRLANARAALLVANCDRSEAANRVAALSRQIAQYQQHFDLIHPADLAILQLDLLRAKDELARCDAQIALAQNQLANAQSQMEQAINTPPPPPKVEVKLEMPTADDVAVVAVGALYIAAELSIDLLCAAMDSHDDCDRYEHHHRQREHHSTSSTPNPPSQDQQDHDSPKLLIPPPAPAHSP